MKTAAKAWIAAPRLVMAVLIVAAVIATYAGSAATGPVNGFNFFGYFTIQSNIFAALVFLIAGLVGLFGGHQGLILVVARACATTYMVITGIVFAVLLAPVNASGGIAEPWANTVLHVIVPIYVAVDWLVFGDRWPIPFRALWIVLVYPLVWTAVVLVRGATDGWVPYPFLNPDTGYLSILVYVIAIAVLFLVVGALVFAASRWRGILQVAEKEVA